MFIDGDGLRWLGLAPHTRVDPGEPVLDRGVGVLEARNLVLIAAPGAMVVTSSIGAASYASQLTRLEGRIMYALGQGPLADDLQSAGQAGRGGNFISLDECALPQLSQSPWPETAAAPLNLNAAVGWHTYTLQSSEDSMPGRCALCMGRQRAHWPGPCFWGSSAWDFGPIACPRSCSCCLWPLQPRFRSCYRQRIWHFRVP